jgi:hypothetical protein
MSSDLETDSYIKIDTREVWALVQQLRQTGNFWHKKATELIATCCDVIEEADPNWVKEGWNEDDCRSFVNDAVSQIFGKLTFLVNYDREALDIYWEDAPKLDEEVESPRSFEYDLDPADSPSRL